MLGIERTLKIYNLTLEINFINDKVRPTNTNDVTIIASYHLPISKKYKLAFGLQMSVKLFDFDKKKLNIYDLTDVKTSKFLNYNYRTYENFLKYTFIYISAN